MAGTTTGPSPGLASAFSGTSSIAVATGKGLEVIKLKITSLVINKPTATIEIKINGHTNLRPLPVEGFEERLFCARLSKLTIF